MLAFLAAAGHVIMYVREDEHLQLKTGEDLSAKALGTTISEGAASSLWGPSQTKHLAPVLQSSSVKQSMMCRTHCLPFVEPFLARGDTEPVLSIASYKVISA